LRGRVLAIGGLKEKLLAARRGGIRTILIPEENRRNLIDLPASLSNALILQPVASMDRVLELALVGRDDDE